MRVLVTGASGFIGRPLVDQLGREDHTVLCITRGSGERLHTREGICWVRSDLSIPGTYKDVIQEFSPEVVIHLAWEGLPVYSLENSRESLEQALALFSFVLEQQSCEKLLVAGSCLEYGLRTGECLEANVGYPTDHFTWAKHTLRAWAEAECKKRGVLFGWMRIFYVYGPKQRETSLIPLVLESLARKALPDIRCPNNANDFIYIDDVVRAFALAVEKVIASGIYNLGTGVATPVLEIVEAAERVIGGSTTISKVLESRTPTSEDKVGIWAGNRWSKENLGWEPETTLEEGIRKIWKWKQ
jgi:UDP-glucose 4-epimerase